MLKNKLRGRRRQLKENVCLGFMSFIYKIGVSSKFNVFELVIVFLNLINSVLLSFFLTMYRIRISNLVIYYALFLSVQLSSW